MRRLATALAVGASLLYYSQTASALPSLEVSTTLGGSEASEYLVRVANPDPTESSGVIELRRDVKDPEHPYARAAFSVPANSTRYFRIPGEKGGRLGAVAVIGHETVRAQERYGNDGTIVIFDIPPRDEQRLHELRVHESSNAVITHASYDETTKTPVLTRRSAVYDGATLVMVQSSVFLSLPAAEREALMTWVRSGGAIAFSLSDERDRDHAPFVDGELGLGRVHVLSYDPWSTANNGDVAIQEKLVRLAENDRSTNRSLRDAWMDMPVASLDPNQGYRGVLPIAGILLVIQALATAFMFRRLATRRGMGSAYRFVAGSSAVTFAAVIGIGIYAKGGFGARVRELSYAQVASGESVAWVQRNRSYFASTARTIEVTPRDSMNVLDARNARNGTDSHATLSVNDGNITLGEVAIRPWQTTYITERGTTTLGGGVVIETDGGKTIVRNHLGSTLHNVVAWRPEGTCVDFGDVANGEEKTSFDFRPCTDLAGDWGNFRTHKYPPRLTLLGEIEEAPTTMDGFRVEKRTTLLRVTVTGGAS